MQVASLFMVVAVVLGAMGAHWLREKITMQQLESFHKGVEYQIYHSIALLFLSLIPTDRIKTDRLNKIFWLFVLGIIFFSGSIYLLAIRDLIGIQKAVVVLGPMTPVGGLFFISGWILLFFSIKK